jgi:hypothetical protein
MEAGPDTTCGTALGMSVRMKKKSERFFRPVRAPFLRDGDKMIELLERFRILRLEEYEPAEPRVAPAREQGAELRQNG